MLVFNCVFGLLWTANSVAFLGFSEIKQRGKHGTKGTLKRNIDRTFRFFRPFSDTV
jgi:hypothetical protein